MTRCVGACVRLSASVSPKRFVFVYCFFLLNRLKVGKDGRTAYERCKGKKATVLGLEFGEKVLYKVRTEAKMAKLRSRWEYGIFIGVRQRSHEIWIATPDKTFAVRSVRRIPEEERWGTGIAREIIDDNLGVPGFTDSELEEILQYICVS